MLEYTDGLSLEEQIGQLLVVGFPGTTPSAEILDLIQRQHVGGIILFSRNVQDTHQLFELTTSLQKAAREAGHRYPLFIAIDQENGLVQRLGRGSTIFPGSMALGAINSPELTYEIEQATGQELAALGVNLNLAPVVDVNNNPANPVIGVRSFGEDPQAVARLGAAAVKGYRSAGIMSCLKHFPGHGDTATDSHLALPRITHTMERMEAIELVPFRCGIEAGADCIMIAHIAFPELIKEDGSLAATVSPTIVRGLLREQLGFEGVIISDCLEMDAIAETIGIARGSVLALQAGVDLVLISHLYPRQQAGLQAIKQAAQTGELSPEVIRQAAERVLHLKERFLSWEKLPTEDALSIVGSEPHAKLRDRAYALSTTLVRNEDNLLPLHLEPEQRMLVVFPQRDAWTKVTDRGYAPEFFVTSLLKRHPQVTALPVHPHATPSDYEALERAAQEAAITLVVTVNAYLDKQQTALMQRLLQARRRVIGLAVYNPYDLLAFPQLGTYLATYEFSKPAFESATRVLFGEIAAQGRLPVSLPGLYPLHKP